MWLWAISLLKYLWRELSKRANDTKWGFYSRYRLYYFDLRLWSNDLLRLREVRCQMFWERAKAPFGPIWFIPAVREKFYTNVIWDQRWYFWRLYTRHLHRWVLFYLYFYRKDTQMYLSISVTKVRDIFVDYSSLLQDCLNRLHQDKYI